MLNYQENIKMTNAQNRILELEEALDLALAYLEDIMGSDYDESATIQHILKLQEGRKAA